MIYSKKNQLKPTPKCETATNHGILNIFLDWSSRQELPDNLAILRSPSKH